MIGLAKFQNAIPGKKLQPRWMLTVTQNYQIIAGPQKQTRRELMDSHSVFNPNERV